jgi:hypothetical protein
VSFVSDRPAEEPVADLADAIMRADKASKPIPQELHLQWNVQQGVPPYFPTWFIILALCIFFLLPPVMYLVTIWL